MHNDQLLNAYILAEETLYQRDDASLPKEEGAGCPSDGSVLAGMEANHELLGL